MDKKTADFLWNNKVYCTKGKRGLIYYSVKNNKKYVIKTKNPSSDKDPIELEADYNKKLNKLGIGPKFHYLDDKKKFMIRDFIEGVYFKEWIEEKKDLKSLKKIILDVLEQCRKLDVAKINKMEMNHPHKDILIDKKNKPWIIDFERCKETLKPKNVTQFVMFLAQGKMHFDLKELNVEMDLKEAMNLTSVYKKEMNKKNFEIIKNYVKEKLTS